MSPPVLKTQLLYISSTFRTSGTPDNFTTSLPAGVLQNPYGGRTKVTVADVIINRCFYSIRASNNDFIVNNNGTKTSIRIPIGNYTLDSWLTELGVLLTGWTLTHNETNGLCIFNPPGPGYSFEFKDKSSYLFGFLPHETPGGAPIISSFPLRLNLESFLTIHHNLPKVTNSAVNNFRQNNMQESDVLIRLPVNVESFANIIYQNTADDFSFYTSASHVSELSLSIKDEHKDSIGPFPYDWSITLRIDYESDTDPMNSILSILKSIDQKLLLLSIK